MSRGETRSEEGKVVVGRMRGGSVCGVRLCGSMWGYSSLCLGRQQDESAMSNET